MEPQAIHAETGARIIDGKAFAASLRRRVADEVSVLRERHNLVPGLAVVLVGEDPASQVYVRNKARQTHEVGMQSFEHRLPADTSEEELLDLVHRLNEDPWVHGILVQLPVPEHIEPQAVVAAINPDKDVDGFHVVNQGRLMTGVGDPLVPCTPLGCLMLLKDQLGSNLRGYEALVVGRSNIVGNPMAQLLLHEGCTVKVAHSGTRDLPAAVAAAEILVVAVGRPELVKGEWIRPGATVIDVGINRISGPDGRSRLVGDVDFAGAQAVAGAITPVPGGVGPMTIACLLTNTLKAACQQAGLSVPRFW